MSIERVNSVFDIPEIKKEWTAFIAGLNDSQKAVVELFTTIQGYKGATLATIGKETDKLAAATAKVVTVTDKMNAAVTKAERAKLAALKTDQQVLRVMQEEEKVLQQTSKTKQASIRLEETMTRQKQRMAKEMEKEVAAAQKTATAYEVLKGRYNQASMESKELAAQMWMTAKGDKALYDQLVKDNKAYQDVTAAAQKYYGQLDALETSVGQYQRRVGQYERSNSALSNSFQQLTREAPAFANSVQTGLMGISNNIPIFADAIKKARGEGQSFGQIMKTLGSSLFSFTGIVGILTTVLTFLPQILSAMSNSTKDYGASLKEAGEETKLSSSAMEAYNEQLKESMQPLAEAQIKLTALSERVKKGGLSYKEKEEILKDYNEEFGDTIGKADNYNELESIMISRAPAYLEYMKLKIRAQAAFNAAMKKQEDLLVNQGETSWWQDVGTFFQTFSLFDNAGERMAAAGIKTGQKMKENAKKQQEDIDALIQEGNAIQARADEQKIKYNFDAEKQKTKDSKAEADKRNEIAEKNAQAEFDIVKARLEYSMELAKAIADNEKRSKTDRRMALYDFYTWNIDLLTKDRDFQLKNTELTKKERELIELEFHLNSLRATQQYYDDLVAITEARGNKISAAEKTILEKRDEAIEDALKRAPKLELNFAPPDPAKIKKEFDVYLQEAQRLKDTVGNFGSAFGEAFSIGLETQKVKIQDLETAQQKAYENEVKRIANSQLSEQEKADKLKILEAERQAQKEANERKTRKLETERARFQKAQDIANIISSTAVAVISALGAKPWTPLNIALAASVGALGAAQLAKAVAVPLPKYAEGTESSKGGWALTDELGPELYIEPGGNTYFGNDKPTLRQLRPGTKIIPSDEIHQHLFNTMMAETARQMQMMHAVAGKQERNDINELKDAIMLSTEMTIREMRRQKKQTNIKNVIDLGWGEYVRKQTFN